MKLKILSIFIFILCFFFLGNKVYADEIKSIENNDIKINFIKKQKKIIAEDPKLDIKVGKKARIDCDEIKVFHQYWLGIEIITPILVVLFGTWDFVKSIISGDEKKIIEARRRFPKRLIAGFLIFLVFVIVSIIVGISKNSSARETTLIECIVNGS